MRMRLARSGSALLLVALTMAVASPALATPSASQMAAARAEAAALAPPPAERPSAEAAGSRNVSVELRESAALVLVGTMLLALAAAVRRTA